MRSLAASVLVIAAVACGIPRDPDGTLERISDGTIRVGVAHAEPWAIVDDGGIPRGVEVSLVERLAGTIGAEVRWTDGSEQELLTALEEGELDLVIGGLV